jgi:hypothetical protein
MACLVVAFNTGVTAGGMLITLKARRQQMPFLPRLSDEPRSFCINNITSQGFATHKILDVPAGS